ncbi:hypothetical protein [Xenorhabdus stockiae]|uniref:hypothetical protein n=1 Tax=Xenorhabdus stockiae TaxID=351614 RepID=UPI004064A2CB
MLATLFFCLKSSLAILGKTIYEAQVKEEGSISFAGAAVGAVIQHDGCSGKIHYSGVAAYNNLYRRGHSGDITFKGCGWL